MRFRVGVNALAGNGDVAPPGLRNAGNGDLAPSGWVWLLVGGRKSVGMPHAVSWLFRFLLHDVVVSSKRPQAKATCD